MLLEDGWIVTGEGVGEPLNRRVTLEYVADVEGHRKHVAFADVAVKMRRVRHEHDMAARRLHPHSLRAFRVAAYLVNVTPGTICSIPS